jgi:predicted metal-dependent phosphoesterase TrpH
MAKVDFHSHTTASDGLFAPKAVVRLAESAGLAAVGITDHDTVAGVKEAIAEGDKRGVTVVPGVEISTLWQGKEIHMLGLFIIPDNPYLLKKLEEQRNTRKVRNRMIIENLNRLGISITMEEVMEKKRGKGGDVNVGRPHIAEVLIDKGIVHSMDEAFDQYLGRGGKAYATPDRISPLEAIDLIHTSGGAAVLAHPGLYEQDDLIPLLVSKGLDGIEVNHPDHTEAAKEKYQAMAEKYGLIATAGSDFHGERNGSMYHAPLGTCTTDVSKVELLRKAALKRR